MNIDIAQKHLMRLDLVVKAAEIKWGIMGRLETLCTPDTATKFARHWDGLSQAIMESRYEDVIVMADGAVRGVWRMEAEAIAAGHAPQALMPFGVGVVAPETQTTPETHETGFTGVVPSAAWFRAGGDEIPF